MPKCLMLAHLSCKVSYNTSCSVFLRLWELMMFNCCPFIYEDIHLLPITPLGPLSPGSPLGPVSPLSPKLTL